MNPEDYNNMINIRLMDNNDIRHYHIAKSRNIGKSVLYKFMYDAYYDEPEKQHFDEELFTI